jgi:hypothetical protein
MPTHIGVFVNTTDDVAITMFFAWASAQITKRRKTGVNINSRATLACFILDPFCYSISTVKLV